MVLGAAGGDEGCIPQVSRFASGRVKLFINMWASLSLLGGTQSLNGLTLLQNTFTNFLILVISVTKNNR